MSAQTGATSGGQATDFDAVVIGAGFGGLRSLHELRDEQGLSVQVFEAGSDVGGTWYWNRYPGARTDTESWAYCFSFDDGLSQDWTWPERFPKQEHVLAYLQHAADRFDFRKDIAFDTRVTAVVYDEAANVWTTTTDDGRTTTSRYVVAASGVLSIAQKPPFLGLGVDGFPNLFTILGPQAPFANMPPIIEKQASLIGRAIEHQRANGEDVIEATPEAMKSWDDTCKMLLDATLIGKGIADRPWFLGANIEGKTPSVLFYFGGAGAYFDELEHEVGRGFSGFSGSALAKV